jgi:hypothetical protein
MDGSFDRSFLEDEGGGCFSKRVSSFMTMMKGTAEREVCFVRPETREGLELDYMVLFLFCFSFWSWLVG